MAQKYDRRKGSKRDQGIWTPKHSELWPCGCIVQYQYNRNDSIGNNGYVILAKCKVHVELEEMEKKKKKYGKQVSKINHGKPTKKNNV